MYEFMECIIFLLEASYNLILLSAFVALRLLHCPLHLGGICVLGSG